MCRSQRRFFKNYRFSLTCNISEGDATAAIGAQSPVIKAEGSKPYMSTNLAEERCINHRSVSVICRGGRKPHFTFHRQMIIRYQMVLVI